ncbi:arylsulfatase [Puteibacter caeruleilacunae]|nr:arylsulfatase [Puteibacter caeruleilacunae]
MIQSKQLLTLGLGALGLLAGCNKKTTQKQELPNIVIVFTDDQGYGDLGCFGATEFQTPNIDKLAEQGARFTNFYAATAVCSASRAGLLTGCYPERVSILGALMPTAKHGLNPKEETIADILKKKGYSTGIFGKWHLGHYPEFLPLKQGFDEYYGLPYSNDMWPVHYDGSPATSEKLGEKHWKLSCPPLPIYDGEKQVATVDDFDDQNSLTTLYTERAVQFIKKNKDKPFFMYVPHSMPHVPLGVSKKFKGKSKQGLYGDVIMEIDWSVGEIMKALKETGNDKNTLVIYTSDNGPWMNYGNHAGTTGGLREAKGAMWEGGHREPCVMRWPGKVPAGITVDKLASSIDLLPTIAHYTGAKLPTNKIDGVNISGLLEGKDVNPREVFWSYYSGELRGIRKGDWKLYFPHKYRSYRDVEPGKDGFPGKYDYKQCGLELYNLKDDLFETIDVAAKHPDIVKELSKLAEQAKYELGDNLTKVKGSEIRPAGQLVKK